MTVSPSADRLAAARAALAAAEAEAGRIAPGPSAPRQRSGELDAPGQYPGVVPPARGDGSPPGDWGGDDSGDVNGRRSGRSTAGAGSAASDPVTAARGIVLRQLALGPRSRAQLAKKLAEKDIAPDIAGQVLDRMTEVGLVDDEAYAEMLVRSKQESRGLATSALAQELRSKGIANEIIEETLAGVDRGDERRRARELAEKKVRTLRGLPQETQVRRLAGMLGRRGYSASVVYEVVRDTLAEASEHRRD